MCLPRKSLPAVSLDEPPDPNESSGPPAMELGSLDPTLEASLDRINLEHCIRRLPAGYRTIFLLHEVQGYKLQRAQARHDRLAAKGSPRELCGRIVDLACGKMREECLLHAAERPAV